jgi:predicted pyridoxine 5'-phosphate oxidase superfamily flavin-nucleotide-binding protein
MSVELNQEIKDAIADKDSIKVIATISQQGVPHVVAKGSITVTEDGQLRYWELLEGSQTNKNVAYALGADKTVAINVITKDRRSYQIKGIPRKSLVDGHEYEEAYVAARNRNPENDLAAVYYIEPVEVIEESYAVRQKEEREKNPSYTHLDKLAKEA